MKVDQLNRLMHGNGRKHIWLMRNSNQLYESALKSYYGRSLSLLPYHPVTKTVQVRQENRAPVRTLTLELSSKNDPATSYPKNHKQMADQTFGANSTQLLHTVMQASRPRSLSSTTTRLPSYVYDKVKPTPSRVSFQSGGGGRYQSGAVGKQKRSRMKAQPSMAQMDKLDLSILSGRSMSLPPRTTLAMNLGYALKDSKMRPPPACKHHIEVIEKTSNATALALAKRHSMGPISDDEQLMVVDKVLKQRLAVRYDPVEPPTTARFRLGYGSGGLMDRQRLKISGNRQQVILEEQTNKELHYHALGERLNHFKLIHFADGPVNCHVFNRRTPYGSGRVQHFGTKQFPKQEPCLSFHNVLHTNYRQRRLNGKTVSGTFEFMKAQQQAEQQTLRNRRHTSDIAVAGVMQSKGSTKAEQRTQPDASENRPRTAREPERRTQSQPRLAEKLLPTKKVRSVRKVEEVLPIQPQAVKGAHYLLAASASHVSAFRRAFKDRQQKVEAELLHMYVHDPSELSQPRETGKQQQQQRPTLPERPSLAKYAVKSGSTLKNYLAREQSQTESKPQARKPQARQPQARKPQARQPPAAAKPATVQRPEAKKLPPKATASHIASQQQQRQPDKEEEEQSNQKQEMRTGVSRVTSPSRNEKQPANELEQAELLKRRQQHQLHQQLRQRRLLSFERLWRQAY